MLTLAQREQLKKELSHVQRGPVALPGSREYQSQVQQYAYSSHKEDMCPHCIITPTDDLDVVAILKYASQRGLSVAVRTGGHQYSGASSTKNGILIDLEHTFQQFIADDDGTVIMGISFRLGDLNKSLAERGLFVPHGQCVHVHVGGHAQTGGYGLPGRAFGLFGDHIQAIKVITADGRNRWIERGTDDLEEADLFWAMLGGSPGNFAVLTHIKLKAHRSADHPRARGKRLIVPYTEDAMRTLLKVQADMASNADLAADFDLCLTVLAIDVPGLDLPPSTRSMRGFDHPEMQQHTGQPIYQKIGVSAEEFTVFLDKIETAASPAGAAGKQARRFLGFEKPGFIIAWAEWANLDGNTGGEQEGAVAEWFGRIHEAATPGPSIESDWDHEGLAFMTGQWTWPIQREFLWPYNKRTYVTNRTDLATSGWVETMLERIGVALDGWIQGARLVVQIQHYGGKKSKFITNPAKLQTSYSWREDTTIVLVMDAFYVNFLPNSRNFVNRWQAENDTVFKGNNSTFAPMEKPDRRLLWGSYSVNQEEKSLDNSWALYYDNEGKYKRLQKIKSRVDPNNVLTPNDFAIHARP